MGRIKVRVDSNIIQLSTRVQGDLGLVLQLNGEYKHADYIL